MKRYFCLKSNMMQSAYAKVFESANKPFRSEIMDLPILNIGECLVRVTFSTICTSDLHTFYGQRFGKQPSVLGHEIIGEISEIHGEGVVDFYGNTLVKGDRVTWVVYSYDHNCSLAEKGYPQKSKSLFKYGHEHFNAEHPLSGGFATFCHLKAGTAIFKIPENIYNEEAAPLNCTHATISGAFRLAGNTEGKMVLVNGAGMLGLSACAMAKVQGAKKIIVRDTNEERARFAIQFGADEFEMVHQSDSIEQDIDVVIETSGVAEAMEYCLDRLTIGGICIWVGAVYSQPKIKIDAEQIVRRLITIKGLHNYIPEDLETAIQFMKQTKNQFSFHKLVGEVMDLEQLDEAFEIARNGKYYRVGITNKK